MPDLDQRPTSFSRLEFDHWLARRRLEVSLAPFHPRGGRPVFKSWLRDVWPSLRELPEARELDLYCERDVTMVVVEIRENIEIAGLPCFLQVFDILTLNRPKRSDIFAARLEQLSAEAADRRPGLQAEIQTQIARIGQAVVEHRDRLSDGDILDELRKFEGRLGIRAFIDRAARIVRELSLRAANHRMAEGIALHR